MEKWKKEVSTALTSESSNAYLLNGIKSSHQSCDTTEKEHTENKVKSRIMLEQCNQRLEVLSRIADERKSTENAEDEMQQYFYYWCVKLRCCIFAPTTNQKVNVSRPPLTLPCDTPEDLLSKPMVGISP